MTPAQSARLGGFIKAGGPSLLAFAFQLAGNREAAEELTQEALHRIARRWPFPGNRSLFPFCRTVLRNVHLDQFRRHEARFGVSLDRPRFEDGASLETVIPDGELTPPEILERREAVQTVRRILKRMPVKYRHVLATCDMDAVPYREAARLLGLRPGTLRSRLHRGRKLFRRLFIEAAHV